MRETEAALAAARRAARRCPGYRRHLAAAGVDPETARFEALPYTDKHVVFGDDPLGWVDADPGATAAAEILTSSGQSGRFSLGIASGEERRETRDAVDGVLRQLGADGSRPVLLVNCLAMGVATPTTLATVATPTVHLEMALELVLRYASRFEIVVIVGEPIFLKELFEAARETAGPAWAPERLVVFVGGEWVAEGWRRHLAALAGADPVPGDPRTGIFVSMGAAELGIHVFTETPPLRAARAALAGRAADWPALFGASHGYVPLLLTHDPRRIHAELRGEAGEETLVCTTLGERLLPLVRYDLEDRASLVDPGALSGALEACGVALQADGPIVAVWGRRTPSGLAGLPRPEAVKEALFGRSADASRVSGRFRISPVGGGARLDVQLREAAAPSAGLAGRIADEIRRRTGCRPVVTVHAARDYPFHESGDYQHKPVYLAPAGASSRSPTAGRAVRLPPGRPLR